MDIKKIISNRSAIKLLIVAAVSSASLVLASESCDPHQRARDMIVPPIAHETAQHTAETPAHRDPHQQASDMMHNDHWPPTSMPQPLNVQGQGGVEIDPHRHAQSMIVGHSD